MRQELSVMNMLHDSQPDGYLKSYWSHLLCVVDDTLESLPLWLGGIIASAVGFLLYLHNKNNICSLYVSLLRYLVT